MNRGSVNVKPEAERAATASMRPRFMNRGSHARLERLRRGDLASMRPRFMNRGSIPPPWPTTRNGSALQ